MSNATSTAKKIPMKSGPSLDFHFEYTVQKGFFAQSEDSTNDLEFDFKKNNFGLINRTYDTDSDTTSTSEPHWKEFETYVRGLKARGENVKVLFLGRHGQGWHNVAETKYGTEAWDYYYSALNGLDGLTWFDATLTPTGHEQALAVHALWSAQIPQGIPPPETYYVSPMTRTIETADATFQHLPLPKGKQYRPLIKENLREVMGVHTCDKRSTRTHLEQTFPHLQFEPGFSDADELWQADYREPKSARRYRLGSLLDDIFAHDEGVFVSLTAHSGAIASILEVVGHRGFALGTGGVIPVFVKAVRREGERRVPEREPSDAPPMWKEPPGEL